MAVHLPRPIELYFASDRAEDADALASCFAADATVSDEGRTYRGLAAISAWRAEARRRYAYTVEPVRAAQRTGKTLVTARVAGAFPGSPATLAFVFELEHDRIASLEIRS